MDIAKAVGSKIRSLRENLGLNREELAHEANISAAFLGDVERGNKEPSLQTLTKVSQALKVPLREILSGIETNFPEGVSKLELLQILQPYLKERYTLGQAEQICGAIEQISAD